MPDVKREIKLSELKNQKSKNPFFYILKAEHQYFQQQTAIFSMVVHLTKER